MKIFNYADDLMIVISGHNLQEVKNAVNWMNKWIKEKGLSFSAGKSQLMLLTKNRKKIVEKPQNTLKDKKGNIIIKGNGVKIGDDPIGWVKEAKYLGLWIDNKLTWKFHTDHIIKKTYKVLAMCKKVIFRDHGASPRVIKWLYEQIVRPVMTYASMIWIKRLNIKRCKNELTKAQRIACLHGTGAYKSTMT